MPWPVLQHLPPPSWLILGNPGRAQRFVRSRCLGRPRMWHLGKNSTCIYMTLSGDRQEFSCCLVTREATLPHTTFQSTWFPFCHPFSLSNVTNSSDFAGFINNQTLCPEKFFVSFDVFLFTEVATS